LDSHQFGPGKKTTLLAEKSNSASELKLLMWHLKKLIRLDVVERMEGDELLQGFQCQGEQEQGDIEAPSRLSRQQ